MLARCLVRNDRSTEQVPTPFRVFFLSNSLLQHVIASLSLMVALSKLASSDAVHKPELTSRMGARVLDG